MDDNIELDENIIDGLKLLQSAAVENKAYMNRIDEDDLELIDAAHQWLDDLPDLDGE